MPSQWLCLFWTRSPWQCQDSVSLVHCTAVTYSHSLTHIYSSSITGLNAQHTQTTAGPPKRMGERQSHVLPLADRSRSCLERCGWLCVTPPRFFSSSQSWTVLGVRRACRDLVVIFGVMDSVVLKTWTAALLCFQVTWSHHTIMALNMQGREAPASSTTNGYRCIMERSSNFTSTVFWDYIHLSSLLK